MREDMKFEGVDSSTNYYDDASNTIDEIITLGITSDFFLVNEVLKEIDKKPNKFIEDKKQKNFPKWQRKSFV
jgi:hypothetical protein